MTPPAKINTAPQFTLISRLSESEGLTPKVNIGYVDADDSSDEDVKDYSGKSLDIEIAGTQSALDVGSAGEVNLTAGKLSAVTADTEGDVKSSVTQSDTSGGNSITYANTSAKLNVDGAILDNEIKIAESVSDVKVGTTESDDTNIVLKKVAIKKAAAKNMAATGSAFENVIVKDNTDDDGIGKVTLDDEEYGFAGENSAVTADTFTNDSAAKIGGSGYTTFARAIEKVNVGQTITLNRDSNIDSPISIGGNMNLVLGDKKVTFTGTDNAALKVSNGTVSLDSANNFLDSNGRVLGIAIANSANVYISGTSSGSESGRVAEDGDVVEYYAPQESESGATKENAVAYIATVAGDTMPAYFFSFSNAMLQLDDNEILAIQTDVAEGGSFSYAYTGSSSAPDASAQREKEFELSGIGTTSGISITAVDDKPGIFSLGATNFATGGASIVDGGSYTFNLTAGTYDKTFTGSSAADNITNAGTSLTINAGGGSDVIANSGSKVSIDGGEDDDSITNTGDNVSIVGGAGNDKLINTGGSATIDGGAGNDEISGSSLGADTFIFNGGSDTVKGFGANDIVSLGTGFRQIANISDLESVTSDSFKLNFGESSITFSRACW